MKTTSPAGGTPAFRELLAATVHRAGGPPRTLSAGECSTARGSPCTLCHARTLGYDREVVLKDRALQEYRQAHLPDVPFAALIPSPAGRAYRSITKRKVRIVKGKPLLGLIDPERERDAGLFPVLRCAIEPEEHARIYMNIEKWLAHPGAAEYARALRYVILRGTPAGIALICNVRSMSRGISRWANMLSRMVTARAEGVTSVWLHPVEEEDRYYLGTGGSRSMRKLFGRSELSLQIDGRRFLFSPFSFSQVNAAMVPLMVETAGELLRLSPSDRFFDLYCGYGLFALALADRAGAVIGLESSPQSVAAAVANARLQKVRNIRFIRAGITAESLAPHMGGAGEGAAVLLDPPRNGTAAGVIEAIAGHGPSRVLHLFCNIDILHSEVSRWSQAGYVVERAVPMDMFPGTATVEILALLKPAGRAGG